MQISILSRALKIIEGIYNESMYGDKDIFRLKDLIHSLDANHWKNKQWAADIFSRIYNRDLDSAGGSILVIGGWYGLLSYLLSTTLGPKFSILSTDIDPKCEKIGYELFGKDQSNIEFKTLNIRDSGHYSEVDAIFCTSVEHIDKDLLQEMIEKTSTRTWVVLQSNNFHDIPSHINTHKSLQDFESWCANLFEIEFSGKMDNGEWQRYMVIGRGKPISDEWDKGY